jgi:adenylate cyclase
MTAATACHTCGTEPREDARFCDGCGSLIAAAIEQAEYKQVTVLFADVVHSMDIAAAVGAERLREIMAELANRCAAAVQRYGATFAQFTGDGIMAVFGAPVALEDHAVRGCLAALDIQEETRHWAAEVETRHGVDLQVRVGLNSGEVVAGEIGSGALGYAAIGEQVGMAQRMESVAPPGGVMLSESTARLVEHTVMLGEPELVRIKGADEPVRARRLVAIGPRDGLVGRTEASLVGRRWEMAALDAIVDRTIGGHGGVVTVVGPPGIGKSRMAREIAAAAAGRGVEVFWTFCESHASDIPFQVVTRLLRASTGVADLDGEAARARVREQVPDADAEDLLLLDDLLGIANPDVPLPQVDPDARRRRLTALINAAQLARTEPALFIIEDAHWIDAVSESMIADFLSVIPQTPSLVLITCRPEYQGALTQVHGAQTIALAPLGDSDAAALIGELLGADPSVGGLAAIVADRAAGNPFFAEEMVRELVQRGVLAGERGGYVCRVDVAELSVPATVQAVLAARIDRLPAEAKSVLNAAAVIGIDFDLDTLHNLQPENVSRLAELVLAELIDQTEFVPRQRYCFHHPLVRTVAYESQLSATRAQTHRSLAAAIETRDLDAADENAALIATHLEAAGEFAEAYRWHLRAAEWLRPRDLSAARAQWENARRIADKLPDDHDDVVAMRIRPRAMLISTAVFVGSDADIDERYREFRDLTTQTGDLTSLAIATAGLIFSFAVNDNRVPEAAALASELEDMVSHVDRDAENRSIILNAVAFVRFANCEFDAALEAIDAIHALSTDVPAVELISANTLLGAIETCAGRSEQGRRRIREELEHARALPSGRYALILIYVVLTTVLGLDQADEMVDHVREALRRAESFDHIGGIITAQLACGTVLLRVEDAPLNEAIDLLQKARANMQKHKGLIIALPVVGADLAIDAARHGRIDEAIDELSATFALHMAGGSPVFVGCAGEALVGLLIERGSTDDLIEAHRIVDHWQDRRPGIPALDLWWLKSRALLAKVEGDSEGYTGLATQYLELCEKLDARGRLDEARQMVHQVV